MTITLIGFPGLRKKTRDVPASKLRSPWLRRFVKDMIKMMIKADGVGLAANQVGADWSVIVLECQSNSRYPDGPNVPLQAYVNPEIIHRSNDVQVGWEGCLSIPGYRGLVPRAREVTFRAKTPDGETVIKTVTDFEARIIQHEVDHINGYFYVDRMPNLRSWVHIAHAVRPVKRRSKRIKRKK